ncbi:MAG: 6,7-dimethyl-8-ribityllumazine synthase [Rhodobacteraceae bacterium]|nr:6,7-dimethyl-8-ribityllumazine synthase [Paracoccaceae bacterium]
MAARTQEQQFELPEFETRPRLLIVAAPYQRRIVDLLSQGARAKLEPVADVECAEIPGALEIPPAIALAAATEKFHGFVALGCVMRGATTHYETVCTESARGLTLLGLSGICIGNGILTVDTETQALERADPARMDKGGEAAAAALSLIALRQRFGRGAGKLGFQLPDAGSHG